MYWGGGEDIYKLQPPVTHICQRFSRKFILYILKMIYEHYPPKEINFSLLGRYHPLPSNRRIRALDSTFTIKLNLEIELD